MRALRFELHGESAFFKKPDVNSYAYFTYSHIHKIALYGVLGAIMGLGGYAQQYRYNQELTKKGNDSSPKKVFPEFYEIMQHAWISIIPHGDRGYFAKKVQIFNNTVGYASFEEGGVLNVREQWLERPHWTIYVADNSGLPDGVFDKLAEYLMNSKAEFMPYLGKNDHPASITSPILVQLDKPEGEIRYIDSLRSANIAPHSRGKIRGREMRSYFKEFMPVALNEENNGYIQEQFVFTNHEIDPASINQYELEKIYMDENRIVYFI